MNTQTNKKNLILELNKYINDSIEMIKGEYVKDFTQEEYEEKLCESIEELNRNAVYFESPSNPCEKFHHIILHSITGKFW